MLIVVYFFASWLLWIIPNALLAESDLLSLSNRYVTDCCAYILWLQMNPRLFIITFCPVRDGWLLLLFTYPYTSFEEWVSCSSPIGSGFMCTGPEEMPKIHRTFCISTSMDVMTGACIGRNYFIDSNGSHSYGDSMKHRWRCNDGPGGNGWLW